MCFRPRRRPQTREAGMRGSEVTLRASTHGRATAFRRRAAVWAAATVGMVAAMVPAAASAARRGDGPPVASTLQVGAEVPALRTANSRTFRGPRGTFVAKVFADPVNFETAKGWSAIDDTLTAAATSDGGFRNAANSYRLHLPQDIGDAVDVRQGQL